MGHHRLLRPEHSGHSLRQRRTVNDNWDGTVDVLDLSTGISDHGNKPRLDLQNHGPNPLRLDVLGTLSILAVRLELA